MDPSEPLSPRHLPVLLAEVLDILALQPGDVVVDATVGLGGHSRAIAERIGPEGRLVGIDRDPASLQAAAGAVQGCRVDWRHGNFGDVSEILSDLGLTQIDAFLADLGVSSPQLDEPGRGFSFRRDGPLDMRMDPTAGVTAAELVAELSEKELEWIFREYGEERFSRQVARRIVQERERQAIQTTEALAEIVRGVVPRSGGNRRRAGAQLDPSTRVFQALRIAVNDELGSLDRMLSALPWIVKPGGRVAIISFHSLEDRRVKHAFSEKETWERLTKSPVVATDDEMRTNPRSRSAKLRGARRRELTAD